VPEHLALGIGRAVVGRGEQREAVKEQVDQGSVVGVVDDAARATGGKGGGVAELAGNVDGEVGGGVGGRRGRRGRCGRWR
jgi:hypothetical protein